MNPLQRASALRKVYYIIAVTLLFTVSMFWRGIIPIPLSSTARAGENRSAIQRAADQLNNNSILNQARTLDLRELEQGETEVEGTFVRLMLLGSNGAATTITWYAIMDKQKRNDFHEMEELVQFVTRLQPHFITPWIFQSWNIAYNVSVEMQGSGDMYHYIARGIDLLAEGERRNSHTYQDRKIGSPDMRYQIAFYYQNKFGVSDQVEVLRCLCQLSCISPDERNPDDYIDKRTGGVDLPKFREFCQKHPHLVRRLRGEDRDAGASDEQTKKKVQEALKCPLPEDIIQFLRDNQEIPNRFAYARQLNDADKQFPILPPKFNEGPNEYNPTSSVDDDFSAYKAARAWYLYSLVPVPPNPLDVFGNPLPTTAPVPATSTDGESKPGEYDPLRYRVPRQPMLIIFRQGAPRAQTAQAEMEQKEGWFEDEGWRVDDPQDQPRKWWFPDTDAPPGVVRPQNLILGKQLPTSLQEWQSAAQMWRDHGQRNGLIVSEERLSRYEQFAQGAVVGLPPALNELETTTREQRAKAEARIALFFYGQNRSVTNFPFFLITSQAEARPETVQARRILWQAEQARKLGRKTEATALFKEGLIKWKAVLAKDANFHRPERSDRIEEETFNYELAYLRLIVLDDEGVRAAANEYFTRAAFMMRLPGLVLGFQPLPVFGDLDKNATTLLGSVFMQTLSSRFVVPIFKKDSKAAQDLFEDTKWYVAETQFSPFAKLIGDSPEDNVLDRGRLGTPWIRPEVKNAVFSSQGIQRKVSSGTPSPNEAAPPNPVTKPLPPSNR